MSSPSPVIRFFFFANCRHLTQNLQLRVSIPRKTTQNVYSPKTRCAHICLTLSQQNNIHHKLIILRNFICSLPVFFSLLWGGKRRHRRLLLYPPSNPLKPTTPRDSIFGRLVKKKKKKILALCARGIHIKLPEKEMYILREKRESLSRSVDSASGESCLVQSASSFHLNRILSCWPTKLEESFINYNNNCCVLKRAGGECQVSQLWLSHPLDPLDGFVFRLLGATVKSNII